MYGRITSIILGTQTVTSGPSITTYMGYRYDGVLDATAGHYLTYTATGTETNYYKDITTYRSWTVEDLSLIEHYDTRAGGAGTVGWDSTWIDVTYIPFPSAWTVEDPVAGEQWYNPDTNLAGGTAPEARFSSVSASNTWRLYAGPFNTAGQTDMHLQWDNNIDDNAAGTGVQCRIQTSDDAATWQDTDWVWDDTVTPGDTSGLEDVYISTSDVGSATFYISFTVTGNADQITNWYIDNAWLRNATGGGGGGGQITLGIIDTWSTPVMNTAWQDWADRHSDIDLIFIDKEPFTFGDLVLTEADALVISQTGREFSSTEIVAIAQYSSEGHGLIGTGSSLNPLLPNHMDLAPSFGLKQNSFQGPLPFTEYIVDNPAHPLMDGLSDPFSFDSEFETCKDMQLDGAVMIAHTDYFASGMITAFERDTLPPVFAGIESCVDAATDGVLDLGWSVATDNSPPITYNVYQANVSGGQNFAAPSYTTSALTYQVTGLINGVEYFYVVRAVDALGNEDTNVVELSAIPTGSRYTQ